MPYCTNCGHANPEGSNFCSRCGEALERTIIADKAVDPIAGDTKVIPTVTEETVVPVGKELSLDEEAAVASLPAGAALLIVHRGPAAGARFLLDADKTTAGRHPKSDIFLDDITVSRHHVEFTKTAEGFFVKDVGSLNGTYVNRTLIDGEVPLKPRDEVQIGKFRMIFFASAPGRG